MIEKFKEWKKANKINLIIVAALCLSLLMNVVLKNCYCNLRKLDGDFPRIENEWKTK